MNRIAKSVWQKTPWGKRQQAIEEAEKDFEKPPQPLDQGFRDGTGQSINIPNDLGVDPFVVEKDGKRILTVRADGLDVQCDINVQGNILARNITTLRIRVAILEVLFLLVSAVLFAVLTGVVPLP